MRSQGLIPSAVALVLCLAWCAFTTCATAEDKEATKFGEGLLRLPEIAFPPSDPTQEAGYLRLFDRDLSIEYRRANFYFSRGRAFELTFDESDFYLRVGGRMFIDLATYFEDKNDLGDNGLGFRNLQIEADGRFNDRWQYRLSWGGLTSGGRFDTGGVFLDDAYLVYTGFERTAWVIGQHKEPFSLENTSSSLANTFMERALPNAFTPGNTVGVSLYTYQKRWGARAGFFLEDLGAEKDIGDQGSGLTGRLFHSLERTDKSILHIGGSASLRSLTSGDKVTFRSRPECGLTDVRYVNTGDILEASRLFRFGLEGALVFGPLSLQAEYIWADVKRRSGFGDLGFDGWYAFVSWFPAGGSRKYLASEGIFGYPDIQSKWGVLELAARYSTIDLTSGTVKGGQEENVTLGVNWYIQPKIRIMANYIFISADKNANDVRRARGDDSPQILQMRLQVRF